MAHPFKKSKDLLLEDLCLSKGEKRRAVFVQAKEGLLVLGVTFGAKMMSLHNKVENGSKCSG